VFPAGTTQTGGGAGFVRSAGPPCPGPGFIPGKINKNNPKRDAFFLRIEIYLAIFVFMKFFYLYLC
jgi:hypothetical protein